MDLDWAEELPGAGGEATGARRDITRCGSLVGLGGARLMRSFGVGRAAIVVWLAAVLSGVGACSGAPAEQAPTIVKVTYQNVRFAFPQRDVEAVGTGTLGTQIRLSFDPEFDVFLDYRIMDPHYTLIASIPKRLNRRIGIYQLGCDEFEGLAYRCYLLQKHKQATVAIVFRDSSKLDEPRLARASELTKTYLAVSEVGGG